MSGEFKQKQWLEWLLPVIVIGGAILFTWLSSFIIPLGLSWQEITWRSALFLGTVVIVTWLANYFGLGRSILTNIQTVEALSKMIESLKIEVEALRKQKIPHLITIREMEKREEKAERVWVFSRALNEDLKIYKEIYENLKRGVIYTYFLPPERCSPACVQLKELFKKWEELAKRDGISCDEILGRVQKHIVNAHCFLASVIVYDEHKDPDVIVKLPSDLPEQEYFRALQIDPKHKEARMRVVDCLRELLNLECPNLNK